MRTGSCHLQILIPESFSLKDKRRVMNSVKQRLKNRFNVSVVELHSDQRWNLGELGLAFVSEDETAIHQIMDQVTRFVEEDDRYEIIKVEVQIY
ncbi:MAG: DUF503 domain-containing protein [Atribacterota bacterium]|nr:DUF503 domain-containing protein [Candidatus Atribacteria bacterium]